MALAVAAGAALYSPVLAGMARQWVTDDANTHGVLLAGGAAWVLAGRWTRLRDLPVQPSNVGFALLALALLTFLAGTLGGDVFLRRVSLPVLIAGCVVALCGTAHLRTAFAPLGLFALAIPLPAVVVTQLTLPLQLIASQVAAGVLAFCQIPVVREGNLLMLQHITLEVADACSGLRSLVSLVSVAALCGAVLSLNTPRTLLLIAASVPIAVIGNGFRVAATGILTTWIGELAVRGVLHDLTGYAAFLVMCGGIVSLLLATRGRSRMAVVHS